MANRPTPADPDPVAPLDLGRCCRALGQAVTGALRPRRPYPQELAEITETLAPLPTPRASVRLTALPQVPRGVATAVVAEGVRSLAPLQIGLRTLVVEHPQARILLDPSVATEVRARVLARMPFALRAAVTPPPDILSTVEALQRTGFDPGSFDLALPTHLHWDHVSGLLDLPDLPALVHAPEWAWASEPAQAPVAGVRGALLGRSLEQYDLTGPPVLTFPRSHDVFGDGSVVLVDLAGHTPGSVGVLLHTDTGHDTGTDSGQNPWVLLAGDAAWHEVQVEQAAQKAGFPGVLVDEDREAAYRSLLRLHVARDRVRVLPAHDHDLAGAWEA